MRRPWAALLAVGALIAGPTDLPATTHGPASGLTVTYGSPAAPPLRLRSLDGDTLDLAGMTGRVVMVNFWATWCPPCLEELPSMQRLWEHAHAGGLEILAVNVGEPADTVRGFLRDFEPALSFPILLDGEGRAFRAWRVRGLPKTFIIDKRGRVIYEAEGGRDMNSEHIRDRIQALIDEP